MKKEKVFIQNKRDYALGQYREVCNAFDTIIKAVCSFVDIEFNREDLERVLNADDREEEMRHIFMRPIYKFQRDFPSYPKHSLEQMKKPYIFGFNRTILALSALDRFKIVGVPWESWQFIIKRPLPKMVQLSKVENEVLNKYLNENATVELTEEQTTLISLTKTLCKSMNQGFNAISYIDYDNTSQANVIQHDRLINDILKR